MLVRERRESEFLGKDAQIKSEFSNGLSDLSPEIINHATSEASRVFESVMRHHFVMPYLVIIRAMHGIYFLRWVPSYWNEGLVAGMNFE